MQENDVVGVILQNVADIKKLKQAGICTIKVSWLYNFVIAKFNVVTVACTSASKLYHFHNGHKYFVAVFRS